MIHKYILNGLYIILDVNSGAVHVATASVYDVLDYFETQSKDEILSILRGKHDENEIIMAYDEIAGLVSQGLLFSEDPFKGAEIELGEPVVKALCLLVAHGCNLRCRYCFAGDLAGGGELMSEETAKKAVDFLIIRSGNRKNLEIDFFGGEPLLNWDVVVKTVNYARSREKEKDKVFRFTITTNGLLLDDEKAAFINKEMSNTVLSMDGRREVHNAMRKTRGGGDSYDAVVPAFQRLVEQRGGNYYVRGTFTRDNLDFSQDVLHIADLGFNQISVEPVVDTGGKEYAIREEDIPAIQDEYMKLAKTILNRTERPFNFFHFMIDLEGGPCARKRMSGCGAGTEYLAVAADGSLFPCHQFAGKPQFALGSLDSFDINNKIRAEFAACNITTKEQCRGCWCKFYCGGGCAANAHMENSDIRIPYGIGCELQMFRTECAIMMKALQ